MTRRRLEDAVKGPRGCGDSGHRWGVRRTALYATESAGRGGQARPGFESRLRHRLAEDPPARDFTILRSRARRASLPYREAWGLLSAIRADRRLRCGAEGPKPTTTGLREWPGLGRTSARGGRAPHRACAAPRAPRGSRGRRGASSRPSRLGLPIRPGSTSPACPSVPCRGGRPPLPGTHRYQHGGLPDAPSLQARRCRRLCLSPPARRRTKAPPTDRRGHEAMAVGAESGSRGRARSDRRGTVAKARGFTVELISSARGS